ncbi:MAG: alkaline shock response membrane anchor protein AmaP [bacterium]|nr:alkaline shock response membrane anchor protein AmaP [bacterium]
MAVTLTAEGYMEWLCRTVAWLGSTILACAAVVVGVGMYLCMLSERVRSAASSFVARAVSSPSLGLHVAATVLLVVVLLMLWSALGLYRLRRRALLINTTEGSVRLSAPMLSRFVKHVVQGCEGVRTVQVDTIPDRRKMTVIASVSVVGQTPVSILAGRLQQQVRRRVIEVFGVDLLREIRVDITHVAVDEKPRSLLPWHATSAASAAPAASATDAAPVLASP